MSAPVGIVCALAREARCLGPMTRRPDSPIVRIAGIGPQRARAAARALLEAGARGLVSFGVCGALDPALRAGDLVIAERVLAADGAQYACDGAWRARVLARLSPELARSAPALLEAKQALAEAEHKAAAFRSSGAAAVDMESASIAAAAAEAGVPFLAVRAVADAADVRLAPAALAALDAQGRIRPARLLRELLARPGGVGELFVLWRGMRAATRALAEVARRSGPELFSLHGSER